MTQSFKAKRIYVVDNGSGDDSYQTLKEQLENEKSVTLIFNQTNLGFGGGCNLAIRKAMEESIEYTWLINSDSVPQIECLNALVDQAKIGKKPVGMVGSWMISSDDDADGYTGSWFNPLSFQCSPIRSVEEFRRHRYSWPTAASLLLSNNALAEVGLFDESFFMYWEDADLAMRIRKAGFSIEVSERARVIHTPGTSSAQIPSTRYVWHLESHSTWLKKHVPCGRLLTKALAGKYYLKAIFDQDFNRVKTIYCR